MRLLLDTHIFLWWLTDNPALSKRARAVIGDADSEIYISAATAWEIAIKQAIGKLDFPMERLSESISDANFIPLPIEIPHTILAGALPRHHADPFDRMLVAQASHEGLTIVSADPLIRAYAVAVLEG